MPEYRYTVQLQGHSESDRTTLNFDIGSPVNHDAAQSAANQLRGALVDVTKAFIKSEALTEILSSSALRPTDNSADCFEEAVVVTHLDVAAGEPAKSHAVRIPAPIDALFLSDAETLNTANTLLIQFIQQLAQHSYVSDGEQIDDGVDNGIKGGYKRSRARKFN